MAEPIPAQEIEDVIMADADFKDSDGNVSLKQVYTAWEIILLQKSLFIAILILCCAQAQSAAAKRKEENNIDGSDRKKVTLSLLYNNS